MKEILLKTLNKKLKVEVPEFQERSDIDPVTGAKGVEYTAYSVKVTSIQNGSVWTIYKRYSDFSRLHNALRANSPMNFVNYRFPNKSVFNTFSEFTKKRRQEGFEELLQKAMSSREMDEEV